MSGTSSDSFVAELKRWRDVRGFSQTRLAALMGFDRSYVSKVETFGESATTAFVSRAEEVLNTGGALTRAWHGSGSVRSKQRPPTPSDSAPVAEDQSGSLVVLHDHARLRYEDGCYTATHRRELLNAGDEPITRYLVRIAVDRYPGEPNRSNEHYRRNPLTWAELGFQAVHDRHDLMGWSVRHDRDSFKELWLLFESELRKFPLYPGNSTVIEYSYVVSDDKWGRWFQRAVRLPTKRLSVDLEFPTALETKVWGTETTMSAEPSTFRSPILRSQSQGWDTYSWSIDAPSPHARYRLEWIFEDQELAATGSSARPSEVMSNLGIVQEGDPLLAQVAAQVSLPEDSVRATEVLAQLRTCMNDVAGVHQFSKGMGVAAPQIGIDCAVALVRTPEGDEIELINPKIIEESRETDVQYEGCLSFFDFRGEVPRPLMIEVEHQLIDGGRVITRFERGIARLVCHEIDHLNGILYKARMQPNVEPIPVAKYQGAGQTWGYPT
jgi:peptide deformylase